jgi:hypothetical protein
MTEVKIKKEFKGKYVAFGSGNKPLGERDDINDLAIMAIESQDPTLLELFESLPDNVAGLKKAKTDAQLAAVPKPPTKTEKKKAEKEAIKAAVPEPFNKDTKVEELNDKTPSSGLNSI